ncbi:MAG: hypothetical protein P4L46_09510 [Fimbriimonas sp.]|nr:hypothetical protein [Fimbriimonas sp.]
MTEIHDIQAKALREVYLAEVSQQLQGRLSPLDTYEALQEMRLHIDLMAATAQGQGLAAADAMERALADFGAPSDVSKPVQGSGGRRGALPLTISLLVSSLFGALIMCNALFAQATLHHFKVHGWPLVFAIGAIYGLCVGLGAWFSRLKPLHIGLLCVGFFVMSYLGRIWALMEIGYLLDAAEDSALYSLSLFLLGFASSALARHLRAGRRKILA